MPRVLMVCLGNICRSPMAEAVLAELVRARRDAQAWTVDSAGTGDWHAGDRPDPRTLAELERHGITTPHRARQICAGDFTRFDLILGMDRQNLVALDSFRPRGTAPQTGQVRLLGAFDPAGESEVPDPYYDGPPAFAAIFRQIDRCCRALVAAYPESTLNRSDLGVITPGSTSAKPSDPLTAGGGRSASPTGWARRRRWP